MKYDLADLLTEAKTGEDALGNPITEDQVLLTVGCRLTEWTAEDVALTGRTVTDSDRKLLVKAPLAKVKAAAKVRVNHVIYSINRVEELADRWVLLYIKGWRP